jgi:hemerythrin
MPLLTWSDRYSVGVKAIDEGQAALIEMLNDLHAAMMRGLADEMMPSLLLKLSYYTRHHISTEEALLEGSGYEGLAKHRARHRTFISRIKEFAASYESGDREVSIQLARFLRDWIATHVQMEDIQYKAWLRKHGAS